MSKDSNSLSTPALRQEARAIQERDNCTYSAALDQVARKHGYQRWSLLMKHNREPVRPGKIGPVRGPDADTAPQVAGRLKHLAVSKVNAIIALTDVLNRGRGGSRVSHFALGEDADTDALFDAIFREDRSPTYYDLQDTITELSHDERMELMALMWIGRDFEGGFEDALAHAYRNSDSGDAMYIAEKSLALADYLRRGLTTIGAS